MLAQTETAEYSLQQIRFFGSEIERFDERVGALGLPRALREVFEERIHIPIVTVCTEETENILRTGAGIVVVTHPRRWPVFPVIAALPRDDLKIIANQGFCNAGYHINRAILPIFTGPRKASLITNITSRYGFDQKKTPAYIRHRRNKNAINDAAYAIRSGGLVLMSPDGELLRKNTWKNGVGYLVSEITDTDAQIVFSNPNITIQNRRPEIVCTFSTPIPADSFQHQKPKTIKSELLKKYLSWLDTY